MRRTLLLASVASLALALVFWLLTEPKKVIEAVQPEKATPHRSVLVSPKEEKPTLMLRFKDNPDVEKYEKAIDDMPFERLRAAMDSFVANYPAEAAEYALEKVREHPIDYSQNDEASMRQRQRTIMFANSIAFALAHSDPVALAKFLAALPDNVRPLASYAATQRFVNDGNLEAARASLTADSEPYARMVVEELAKGK